jgi:hypothetical protein
MRDKRLTAKEDASQVKASRTPPSLVSERAASRLTVRSSKPLASLAALPVVDHLIMALQVASPAHPHGRPIKFRSVVVDDAGVAVVSEHPCYSATSSRGLGTATVVAFTTAVRDHS